MRDGETEVQVWRWRVVSPGPHLALTLPVMEAVRSEAGRLRRAAGHGPFPERFHGGGGTEHQHAFWLPEDDDGDGLIDHILVYCAGGIDAQTIAALAAVERLELGGTWYRLLPSWMGARPVGGLFGPAKDWCALTPYITTRHWHTKTGKVRAACAPEAQFARELELRGLPMPAALSWQASEWCGEDLLLASQFVWKRAKENETPPSDAVAAFARLSFAEPVMGPLAIGYNAHFGMGMLLPCG